MKYNILTLLGFFIAFWGAFLLLQNSTIYHNSLGKIADNWVNHEGERQLVNTPFQQVNHSNYLQWDGVHYHIIKEYGYDIEKAGSDYIFAFFPFFPFLWKVTALPPIGVLFMNYFLFAIASLILMKTFETDTNSKINLLLIIVSIPTMAVFLIPYTEATFLITAAIGLYGIVKNKYWLFFIGFFLCALTKPSYTFLFLAILATEILFLMPHKKVSLFVRNIFLRSLPLIIGTIAVSSLQSSFKGGSSTKFVEVQKYWNHVFSLPNGLRDWSQEGFGISLGIIFLIIIPLITVLIKIIYTQFFSDNSNSLRYTRKNYVLVVSTLYLIGIFLFIVFFQGGSLHGLSRYILCNPFFFVLVFCAFSHLKKRAKSIRLKYFILLTSLSIVTMGVAGYSSGLNFSDFGLFLLISVSYLWYFQDESHLKRYKITFVCTIFSNVIWTAYLFNMYISNGWIYT
jgi:hypothetical protein